MENCIPLPRKMDKQKLIEELKNIRVSYMDEEKAHKMADILLLKYINDEEVIESFNNIKKWYA